MYKKYGAFSSSVNPQNLSATVEGAIQLIASILVFGGFLTVADSTTLLAHTNQLIGDVMVLVPLVSAMWGLCTAIFGLIRKGVVAMTQKTIANTPILVAQSPITGAIN